jgi:hypothetical protein
MIERWQWGIVAVAVLYTIISIELLIIIVNSIEVWASISGAIVLMAILFPIYTLGLLTSGAISREGKKG